MITSDLGSILGVGEKRRVELTRILPHPIEDVWEALVDPAAVAKWFTDAVIDAREGGRMELTFGDTKVFGTIKTFVPPHVLAYTWTQEGESVSLVQFDLIRTGESQTRLTVVQTALDSAFGCVVAAGWHIMLDRLAEALQTYQIVPLDAAREEALLEAYQERFD